MISDMNQVIITPKRRRKLTIQDVQAIAECVATLKLTETEACLHLDIPVKQWQCWKNRAKHSANFESIITRTRASNIAGLVNKIKEAGEDYEIQLPNDKVVTKRGDWRANAFVLERVEPRFQQNTNQPAPASITLQIGIIHDQLKKVIGFDDIKLIEDKPKFKMPVRRSPAV